MATWVQSKDIKQGLHNRLKCVYVYTQERMYTNTVCILANKYMYAYAAM